MTQSIEIKDFDRKGFGAFLCINTTECETWAVGGDKPMIISVTTKEDLERMGWGDEYIDMKVGEVRQSEDYEGCYLMRVG